MNFVLLRDAEIDVLSLASLVQIVRLEDVGSLNRKAAVVVLSSDSLALVSSAELRELVRERLPHRLREGLEPFLVGVVAGSTDPGERAVVLKDSHVVGAWIEPLAVAAARPSGPDSLGSEIQQETQIPHVAPPRRRPLRGRKPVRPSASPRAASPTEAEPRIVRRTPHLEAPGSLATAPGTRFEIVVWTDTAAPRDGEDVEELQLIVPPDVDALELSVFLSVSAHFSVEGEDHQKLTIRPDTERSPQVRFSIVIQAGAPSSDAQIIASFSYQGRPCGRVTRAWAWPGSLATMTTPSVPPSPKLRVHIDAAVPDLSVNITAPDNDRVSFRCHVEAPVLTRDFGSSRFVVDGGAATYVSAHLGALLDDRKTPAQRRRALEVAGHEFFRAAPSALKVALWTLIDEGRRPRSIAISSAEATLPWELMIPRRKRRDGGGWEDLKPLGVEFAIGRWISDFVDAPPEDRPVRNAFLIAPTYEGDRVLDATPELKLLTDRLHGERIPATLEALDAHFAASGASILHFACHGGQVSDGPVDEAIALEDAQLCSGELLALAGFKRLCEDVEPIIFLNACEGGRLVPSLGGTSGFPRAFADIGARAIIAPLWPVEDAKASEVAVRLYTEALKPNSPPLAQILRDIRVRAYEEDDSDTYAAYCFFGDPNARLRLSEDPPGA